MVAGPAEVAWNAVAARLIGASVLLYAGGMILNDHADRAADARLRPERPIPSGAIRPGVALALGILCLAGSLLLSPVRWYHGLMALLVLGYDYVIKRNVAGGAVTMGALRGLNLLAPCACVEAGFSSSKAIEAGAGYFLYIVAVTLLGVLEDAERIRRRAVLGLVSIPPLVVLLVVYSLPQRWPASGVALGLAGVFLWRHRNVEWNQASIRRAMTWLLLGTMLYTALIALGTGHWIEALAIGGMLFLARLVARRIALT